jgi:hypothetical protein
MPTHTAPVKTARGWWYAPKPREQQPRALVVVLTGAVHGRPARANLRRGLTRNTAS